MIWDLSESDYPQIKIDADPVQALALWVEKIIDMAPDYDAPWTVLVADLWPNYGESRLIGHVQMDDVAVGYDTGYRVCAYLHGGGLEFDEGDDRPVIAAWLRAAVAQPALQQKLRRVAADNPFEIRLTHWGENPIREAILISY